MKLRPRIAAFGCAVEGVLFDLDGTIVDSHAALREVFWRFIATQGIAPEAIDIHEFDGLTIPQIVAKLRAEWSLAADGDALTAAYLEAVREAYATAVSPFRGAAPMLDCLHRQKVKMALVTAAVSSVLNPLLARIGWLEVFDAIVPGDAVPRGKPAPDGYRSGLRILSLLPSQALAVEDSPSGVAAARAAGLNVVGIAAPARAALLSQAGASAVLPSIGDLMGWLQKSEMHAS